MFDRLIDIVTGFGEALLPFTIVDDFQEAVILRFGKFSRSLKPGIHFMIPFLERVIKDNVVLRTTDLSPQSLVTQDNKTVTIRLIATWRITDIKKALLEVEGIDDVLKDTFYASAGEYVQRHTFAEISQQGFATKLKGACQRRAEEYGVTITRLAFGELSECLAIRQINY